MGAVAASSFVVLVGPAAGAGARRPEAVQTRLDKPGLDAALASAVAELKAPGAQAAIVECGQPLWEGKAGVTDLSAKPPAPVTNATPFVIASTTKTVTATMIMQQIQDKRLTLATPVSKYYPAIPAWGKTEITVKDLLSNRSGLPAYEDDPDLADIIAKDKKHTWTRAEIIKVVEKPQLTKLKFKPGSEEDYINTNWIVLGGILEQVMKSKEPIETYFKRMIADRAGMTSSLFATSASNLPPNMARPYERAGAGPTKSLWIKDYGPPSSTYGPVFTDGGLVSTATDLARFGNALLGDVPTPPESQLLPADLVKQMIPVKLAGYGLGLEKRQFPDAPGGTVWVGHNGSYGGYESENYTDPTRHVTITVTTNLWDPTAPEDEAGFAEKIWNAVVKAYDAEQGNSRPARCSTRS